MTKILLPHDWVLCLDLQLDLSRENSCILRNNSSEKMLKKMAAREYRSFVAVDGEKLTTISEGRVFYSKILPNNESQGTLSFTIRYLSVKNLYIDFNNDGIPVSRDLACAVSYICSSIILSLLICNLSIKPKPLRRGQSATITTTIVVPRILRRLKSLGSTSEVSFYNNKGFRIRQIRKSNSSGKHRKTIVTNASNPLPSIPTTINTQNGSTNEISSDGSTITTTHNTYSKRIPIFRSTIFDFFGLRGCEQSQERTYGSNIFCSLHSFRIHLLCGVLNLLSAFAIYFYCNYCLGGTGKVP